MRKLTLTNGTTSAIRMWSRIAGLVIPAIAGLAILFGLGFHFASGQETLESYQMSRSAQQGKDISPVPVNVKGKRAKLVFLGSYIVNGQGGCNDCHTCPSYRGVDPYSRGLTSNEATPVNTVNFLAGGTPFTTSAGQTSAPSLTPDPTTGRPGNMTYAQFKDAMQNGHNSKTGALLQVMPWPIYRNMYENDLVSVYEYLSAIPSAPSGAGQCTGPSQAR